MDLINMKFFFLKKKKKNLNFVNLMIINTIGIKVLYFLLPVEELGISKLEAM